MFTSVNDVTTAFILKVFVSSAENAFRVNKASPMNKNKLKIVDCYLPIGTFPLLALAGENRLLRVKTGHYACRSRAYVLHLEYFIVY